MTLIIFPFADFETYLKTKIEKLAQLETDGLDCKSPDYNEHFSTKSFDESKVSVYFTPAEGHLSPQPMQSSPIHINYINENIIGCESADYDEARGHWRSSPIKNSASKNASQRNSFFLPSNFIDETDELHGNFIIPDPVYNDGAFTYSSDRFQDVMETPSTSIMSVDVSSDQATRRRKKRYKDHRRSRHSIENETLLLQDISAHDVSKGARPKLYGLYGRRMRTEGKTLNISI